MLRSSWFRLLFAATILMPALVCQTAFPVMSFDFWESAAEELYAKIMHFNDVPTLKPSRVAILEVDQKTIDAYGWPISRDHYVETFEKLAASGRPHVLSFLNFQELDKESLDPAERVKARAQDDQLAVAMDSYGRIIGSGLRIEEGEELTTAQEDNLIPRIWLTPSGKVPAELPYLPLTMTEADRFVDTQAAFGVGPQFGTEPIVHCMPMFLVDRTTGSFVLPSSIVWTAVHTLQAKLFTSYGAAWPRQGEKVPWSPRTKLAVAEKHCLPHTGVLTKDYLQLRGIETLSLVDFLKGKPVDFTGKAVILAQSGSRLFRGPGSVTEMDNGIVNEHVLVARFLDAIMTRSSIRRDVLEGEAPLSWLPLLAAAFIALASMWLSTGGTTLICLAMMGGMLVYTVMNLADGLFLIPIQAFASVSTTATALVGLLLYLRYYGVRRQVRLAGKLRERLPLCNTLKSLEEACQLIAEEEFGKEAGIEFCDHDAEWYEAAGNPQNALVHLGHAGSGETRAQPAVHGSFGPLEAVMTSVGRSPGAATRMPFKAATLDVKLEVAFKNVRLGTLRVHFNYKSYEDLYIAHLVEGMRAEVALQWNRVRLLAEQKLADYKILAEKSRTEIMERFLSQVLVRKFADDKTMEENLKAVLTPRSARAALLQADIRGYSEFSARMEPLTMVRLLQSYFREVVDHAQGVAQVKLIGDCIFLFIERGHGTQEHSPADLALNIASTLVRETERRNQERQGEPPLNFGIAIHYGDVVIGNLSSESCIDYTVIGPNVNLVARLEELTKKQEVRDVVGTNGIIVSTDAARALAKYRSLKPGMIDLPELGVNVRSFAEVQKVAYFTAADAQLISREDILPDFKAAG